MSALLDQKWVHSNGGGWAIRKDLKLRAENLRQIAMMPARLILGAPQLLSTPQSLYAIVPVRGLTQGFPHDVESRGYFAAISRDNGKTWASLDTACADAVQAVFKDFPVDEVGKVLAMRFDPSRTIKTTAIGRQSIASTAEFAP
jgi:hypothetical protein